MPSLIEIKILLDPNLEATGNKCFSNASLNLLTSTPHRRFDFENAFNVLINYNL